MQVINKSWYDNSHSLKSVNLYLLFTYDLSFHKSHGKNKKCLKFSFLLLLLQFQISFAFWKKKNKNKKNPKQQNKTSFC